MANPPPATKPSPLPCAVHVVGIGGAGMAAVAEVLLGLKCQVTGSDIKENPRTQRLSELGIELAIGHAAGNAAGADIVVHSTAIQPDNAELAAARQAGIPVWNRADLLHELGAFKEVLAVAGTHGKTTTASMLSLILKHARLNPSFIIGGDVNEVGSGASWNTGDWLVVEADESDGSFLALGQSHAIITSIEADHHTRYESYQSLCGDFAGFLANTRHGAVVHSQAAEALAIQPAAGQPPPAEIITYGTEPPADYQIADFTQNGSSSSFAVLHHGQPWAQLTLPVPGLHNAENALAALLAASQLGVGLDVSQESLSRFAGIARRFEFRGAQGGVTFVDDYAHLPTEVAAAIRTALDLQPDRLVCVFQPHRYSRTKSLWAEFANSFAGADVLVVADVYSAGEMPLPGVTGELILQAVRSAGDPAGLPELVWAPRLDDVVQTLTTELTSGDLCLILGAGDIHLVIDQVQTRRPAQLAGAAAATAAAASRPEPDPADREYFQALCQELQALLPQCEVASEWPLGQHTSYRVGGPASLAVKVDTRQDLARLAEFLAAQPHELPWLALGNGTNLLVADAGFAGLALRLGEEFAEVGFSQTTLRAGAGAALPVAARQAAAAGLGGFEWAVGVPGTIGGGVKMNAGGHGSDISQSLRAATVCDLRDGSLLTLAAPELQLAYRHSALTASQLVCEAEFELAEADPASSKQLISEILRWRREHQPGGQNCGSVFVNPPEESAGALLDRLGLKGFRVGTASISDKHANFIIADRHGSADDVLRLMHAAAEAVLSQTGIELTSETALVGFDAQALGHLAGAQAC